MAPSILSFDLTGTLATFKYCDAVWFEGMPRLYAERHGVAFDEARDHLRQTYDELGDEAVDWYDITYWFDRFDLGDGWGEVLQSFSHTVEFYPEASAVLEELSARFDLVMITNACREFAEVETASISKHFSRIISCVSDFGEVKKTPDFYARVCRSLGEDPSNIVHVGDHWNFDFLAPRGTGITSYYLDRQRERTGEFIIHDLGELVTKLL